jgi:hypothetical protein
MLAMMGMAMATAMAMVMATAMLMAMATAMALPRVGLSQHMKILLK